MQWEDEDLRGGKNFKSARASHDKAQSKRRKVAPASRPRRTHKDFAPFSSFFPLIYSAHVRQRVFCSPKCAGTGVTGDTRVGIFCPPSRQPECHFKRFEADAAPCNCKCEESLPCEDVRWSSAGKPLTCLEIAEQEPRPGATLAAHCRSRTRVIFS